MADEQKNIVDLHTHSTASDGSFSPSAILQLASELKIKAVALTDHDTIAGIEEFVQAGEQHPELETVPGVEVSVTCQKREIHITGLFIDHKCQELAKVLADIQIKRSQRNLIMVDKISSLGYDLTYEDIKNAAGGEVIGRPHFAKALVRKGYFSTPQEVFEKCLRRGAPAYCERVLLSPAEAIQAIHNAGGLTFWAHPLSRPGENASSLRRVMKELVDAGLDGLEAYYTVFTQAQHDAVLTVAKEYNLLISGGSDFHGENQPGISLGSGFGSLSIPYSVFEDLKNAWLKKRAATSL